MIDGLAAEESGHLAGGVEDVGEGMGDAVDESEPRTGEEKMGRGAHKWGYRGIEGEWKN